MLLQESARALSFCPGIAIPVTCPPLHGVTSSCFGGRQWPLVYDAERASASIWNRCSARCYASLSSRPPNQRPPSPPSEYAWPTSRHPTPYEILAHPKDARYNKGLFYELVKIYHPDTNHITASSIPHAIRLERYRLVVAANGILSDGAKRKAYDLYGAGWGGSHPLQSVYREADRSWRDQPGNASRNATWEDWERWRNEKNGEKQQQTPVYMSNELFAFVLCSVVVVGSYAQARRASTSTSNAVEMLDQKHIAISDDMIRRQNENAPLGRHERIESFLRQRDCWNIASSRHRSPEPPS
ncbi:hypothetical protein F4802DRAFT_216393 [Xylaria palmicola]|nr:hypothetical protein F4802DRAFT_216393 [Xylaria palmicola]